MPPVAAAVGAIGAAIGSAAVAIGGFLASGGILANLAITAALGAASYLLTPKPTAPKIEVRDRKVTIRQPVSPRQVIYGQSMAGGVITYAEVLKGSGLGKNKHLALVITFAGHECESLEALYLNEVPTVIRREGASGDSRIPAGYIRQGRFKDFIRMDYRLGTPQDGEEEGEASGSLRAFALYTLWQGEDTAAREAALDLLAQAEAPWAEPFLYMFLLRPEIPDPLKLRASGWL